MRRVHADNVRSYQHPQVDAGPRRRGALEIRDACECKDPRTRTCMREPEASWMSRMTRPSLPSRVPTSHVCNINLTLYWPSRVLCTIAEYVSNIVASTSPSVGKALQAICTL